MRAVTVIFDCPYRDCVFPSCDPVNNPACFSAMEAAKRTVKITAVPLCGQRAIALAPQEEQP